MPTFSPWACRCFDGLLGDVAAGAHEDDDALGIGCADVFEELVLASGEGGKAVHLVLHDGGQGEVVGVDGLAGLEVDVGILRGAAQHGTVGRERAQAVLADALQRDHGAHIVFGELLDLVHLVRGAEAVKEMDEGNARLQGCGLGDERGVHDFLDVVGGQQRPAGLADGHDVLSDRRRWTVPGRRWSAPPHA